MQTSTTTTTEVRNVRRYAEGYGMKIGQCDRNGLCRCLVSRADAARRVAQGYRLEVQSARAGEYVLVVYRR